MEGLTLGIILLIFYGVIITYIFGYANASSKLRNDWNNEYQMEQLLLNKKSLQRIAKELEIYADGEDPSEFVKYALEKELKNIRGY